MAAASKVPRQAPFSTASTSAGPSGSRSPVALTNASNRAELALLAPNRRANSSSSSSAVTTSSADSSAQSATTPASSVASLPNAQSQDKGKGKQVVQNPLRSDEDGFFSSGKTVQQLVDTYNRSGRQQSDAQPLSERQPTQQPYNDRMHPKTSLLFSVNPLPALSEKSAISDLEDMQSSTSENVSDSEGASVSGAIPGMRRASLRIELPPPPAHFKDKYPSILVDSTHASDSEASGTSNAGTRRRRRRSTASTMNRLGEDAEDAEDDEDDYADDDSSWPSTPSTTPLEAYFTAADSKPKAARKAVQTTKEIIAPAPDALGMGRPMVVVTSPSTASEVSSDRRSSSGSGSTTERLASSSPPGTACVAPAPALSKIEEHPSSKDEVEASSKAVSGRSLSFDVPAVPRFRASEESLPIAAPVRSPSRAMAFLAKIGSGRAANRSSVDLASTAHADVSGSCADLSKKRSLESQRNASAEQRRSVELRPILLNAATRPQSRALAADASVTAIGTSNPAASPQHVQQQRRSSGRVPIRPNVVPYHSRRSSEISEGSSKGSPMLQDRASFDRDPFDPRYSPSSQVTTLTMPSPALSDQKHVSHHAPVTGGPFVEFSSSRLPTAANAPKDRFAVSMASLHDSPQEEARSSRRSPPREEGEDRPSAIRLLVDSQKGRLPRDHESIAEWISVSVNDLPLPDATHPYGNGGKGEFSNELGRAGKKLRKNKPWKLGRFAASEVVLPTSFSPTSPPLPSVGGLMQTKRQSIAVAKRGTSAQVDDSTRASVASASSPHKGPFMRNLGFTTANRNVVLQNLCAEKSISALAASSIYIAGCGRINLTERVPVPSPKSTSRPQVVQEKRRSFRESPQAGSPSAEVVRDPVGVSQNVNPSRGAYLNVSEDRHIGYDVSGTVLGTVKSMVPETGDWSGSSGHDSAAAYAAEVVHPFRDYEDEGSDLFDSDRSQSDSDDEMGFENEDAEIPVRFGQRVNLVSKGPTVAAAPQTRSSAALTEPEDRASEAFHSSEMTDVKTMVLSPSIKRLSAGAVVLQGAELRICVEEVVRATENSLAYWKATEVLSAKTNLEETKGKGQRTEEVVRRQPSNKAMKLEEEVATGIFAAFVGNRSPRRQARRGSFDISGAEEENGRERGSPRKHGDQRTTIESRELLISKLSQGSFLVRSEVRTTSAGEEQTIEIIRRIAQQSESLHARHVAPGEHADGAAQRRIGTPRDKVERAFPSPLLSNEDVFHGRPRSKRTDGSQGSLTEERVMMRIQRNGGRGFLASFQTLDGQQWMWSGSKLEASVLTPSKTPSDCPALGRLEGYDMSLRACMGQESIELATYSTNSEVRNALGLFKPRTKTVPKPLPNDEANIGPAVPPPARVLPLAIPLRGPAGPTAGRRAPPIPRRGIRGGPLLQPQHAAAGNAALHHGLWQHQRAAISSEAVVKVHNNAVYNARASLQVDKRPDPSRTNPDTAGVVAESHAAPGMRGIPTEQQKEMGKLRFSAVDAVDRDLIVVSLLAVMGAARV